MFVCFGVVLWRGVLWFWVVGEFDRGTLWAGCCSSRRVLCFAAPSGVLGATQPSVARTGVVLSPPQISLF